MPVPYTEVRVSSKLGGSAWCQGLWPLPARVKQPRDTQPSVVARNSNSHNSGKKAREDQNLQTEAPEQNWEGEGEVRQLPRAYWAGDSAHEPARSLQFWKS